MNKCEECGKKLGIFEGYYHPALGKNNFVCYSCFIKIEESVSRWKQFIISNSNTSTSSESLFDIDWNYLFNRLVGFKKRLIEGRLDNNSNSGKREKYHENTLNDLSCKRKYHLLTLGKRSV